MYLIRDRTDDPEGFPFGKLLRLVLGKRNGDKTSWTISEADGYGSAVYDLKRRLDRAATLHRLANTLIDIVDAEQECFYDLHCEDADVGITFGIFDSSFLFLDAPPEIAEPIARAFNAVEQRR